MDLELNDISLEDVEKPAFTSALRSTFVPISPNHVLNENPFSFQDLPSSQCVGNVGVCDQTQEACLAAFSGESPNHVVTSKKISPISKLKKRSPAKVARKMQNLVKGTKSSKKNLVAAFNREEGSVFVPVNTSERCALREPITDKFSSSLALAPKGLPILSISELSDAVNFRFAFEGRVLCKYGTYKLKETSYARFLKADLIDKEARHTLSFVVSENYMLQFVESFEVNDFLRIEGGAIKRRVRNDGGTSMWALHADATTLIVKAEPFVVELELYPEHKIRDLVSQSVSFDHVPTIAFIVVKIDNSTKADGGSSARLTIADGPASIDRASLLFVPSRRYDYHLMVNAVKEHGSYSCVAHNINVFKQCTNTLSIIDATILCSLPHNLLLQFRDFFSKQVANLGFGKKVFGSLEIVNVNSVGVEFMCEDCKGSRVSRQNSNPYCFSCNKVTNILKVPSLQGKITIQDGSSVVVTLHGKIVDEVLQMSSSFLYLYEHTLVDLKSSLTTLKKVGTFSIDNQGHITSYKNAA